MSAPHVTTVVEFALGSHPVGGSVQVSGARRPFQGWMELMALLEQVAQDVPTPNTQENA